MMPTCPCCWGMLVFEAAAMGGSLGAELQAQVSSQGAVNWMSIEGSDGGGG